VANNYILLRSLDEQLKIAEMTLKSYGESVDYFQKQFKYGQTSQMTVAQAMTQYELAAVAIPQIKAQIVQTENILSVLLGHNPGCIPRGKSITELTPPAVPAGIPSEILARRPDVLQAEENLIAANALIGAAIALYFPSISLTGIDGFESSDLDRLFTGPSRTWNYTGSAVGPIFTWGLVEGQVEQAEANQQAALYSYQKAIINAFSEVETALSNHTQLIDQVDAQEKLVNASKEYEHLAELQFFGGYSPYFVVLQAQQQLFPSELSLAQQRGQLLTSLVNIYAAMGGGWVIAAEQMTVDECDCN
jgi:multidrug efflux system outer membrane protein